MNQGHLLNFPGYPVYLLKENSLNLPYQVLLSLIYESLTLFPLIEVLTSRNKLKFLDQVAVSPEMIHGS